FENELETNMRARRDFGWQVALKAMEPVPLLGLADQLAALPDCPDGVIDRDLDSCGRKSVASDCEGVQSGGHNVCRWGEADVALDAESDEDKAVLLLVNDAAVDLDELDLDARLDVRAATNIVAHRDGADGIAGTGDDDSIDSISELDDIGYVGQTALGRLAEYAVAQGYLELVAGTDDGDSSAEAVCAPVCDNLALDDGSEIPTVPRFQTWYGVEDITHIFKTAYDQLSDEEKFVRAPLSEQLIANAFFDNNTKKDRLSSWPLRRYTKAVDQLFGCELEQMVDEADEAYEDRCALQRQSQFSGAGAAGGGIARIMYTPAMTHHMVENYAQVLDCADDGLSGTWCAPGEECDDGEDPENFSTCFASEFPADGGHPFEAMGLPALGGTAVVKLTWSRIGFDFALPAYDTSAAGIERRTGGGANALWSPEGDNTYLAPAETPRTIADIPFPTPDDIYTIQTRGGSMYRLTGMHVMTKEARHWVWVTMWWSDKPDDDFGADRPEAFSSLDSAWSNYKMCVVVDYTEGDADPAGRYGDHPSLAAALAASADGEGAPTWCSNPYIEHGAGNARTNCIGCHQHAGTREFPDGSDFELESVIAEEDASIVESNRFPANGRIRRRDTFATDYSWAFSRMDDLTELMRKEVEFENVTDARWGRLDGILRGEGDVEAGEAVFRAATESQTCTDCHGEQGEGGFGPNLESRFAAKTQWELLYTVVEGRANMPAWGEQLEDQQLTDLMAYLSATFADPEIE
ncbi:MAG: cytochrome c, partial [Nannocystaceae bacterium]|nr:cytochrome c [Nannocystaceae bacterium]